MRRLRRTLQRRGLALVGALVVGWLVGGERGRLIQPSTRRWMRLAGWRQVLTWNWWEAYVYARWTNQYIGWAVKHVFPRLQPVEGERRWADTYHGKILPTALAQALVSVNEPVPLQDLEQIIPYATARDIVLQGPPDVAAYECGCRHARENPCQPTQVCMVIGQPFVDFVLEHNPDTSRRLTQAEAVALLQAEHERGHLHAAYFRVAMLNRMYAICNCCPCCCAGLEAMLKRGVPMVASSGYVAQVDPLVCQMCGTCEGVCPFQAIQVNGVARVDWDKCMGCGVCEGQCPEGAITLVLDARKGPPLDVRALIARS